jgi:hypothetical protein
LIELKEKYNQKRSKNTNDYINLYKEFVKVNKKVDRTKEELFNSGTGNIFNS